MNDQIYNIINSSIVLIAAIIGFLASFFREKWRQKQNRKDDEWKQKQQRINKLLEKRMKVYGEGLEFIYEVEQHQTDADELERIIERWKKWYPKNSIVLPPSVNDALYGAMHWTFPVMVDLHNRQSNRETMNIFREHLQKAKTQLMSQKDIGWLHNDLK